MNFLLLNLIIALFSSTATSLFVVLLVLIKSWNNKANRYYAYTLFSVAWWTFFQALAIMTNSPDKSLLFGRLLMSGVWMIPVFQTHYVVNLFNLKNKRWIVKIGYILGFFSVIMNFTPYMFLGIKPVAFLKYWTIPNTLFYFTFVFFLIYAAFVLFELFRGYKSSAGAKYNQLAYIFWSTLMGYAGGSTNFFYTFGFAVPYINPFATYLITIFPIIIAYAILKHQIMDISIAVKKTFFYSISIAGISGLMVGISLLSSWFKDNIPGFQFWLVPAIVGATTFIVGRIFWNKSKEVDKLKYEFITVATHKLRTPLTDIKWAAASLKDEKIPLHDKDKLVEGIISANGRLIDLTNELLTITKTEANRYQYNFERADLEKVVRKVVNDFQIQMKERGVKLIYNAEKNLPKVKMDKERIGSVVRTLLENAILYTKDEIKINIDVYKNSVIFHVEDNGRKGYGS